MEEFEDIKIGDGPFVKCSGCGKMERLETVQLSIKYALGWKCWNALNADGRCATRIEEAHYCPSCSLIHTPVFYYACWRCNETISAPTWEEIREQISVWGVGWIEFENFDLYGPFCPKCRKEFNLPSMEEREVPMGTIEWKVDPRTL